MLKILIYGYSLQPNLLESFAIEFHFVDGIYDFPHFAFKNASLRNLVLRNLELNPSGSVNWPSLVSLSIGHLNLTESALEKVLSGCPNLDCLKLDQVSGIHRLEISSAKLRKLIIKDYYNWNHDLWLEILAPFIQTLQLLGQCSNVCVPRKNVPSLVTAVFRLDRLGFHFDEEDNDDVDATLEKQYSNMKELLHSVAHVENLELSSWCIQNRLLGYTNEDEQSRRFETHNFDYSLLHLKTIKITNFGGPLYGNKSLLPFLEYLLKKGTVLEKFIIAAKFEGCDVPQYYVKMAQEFHSFPSSSTHALVVFSY